MLSTVVLGIIQGLTEFLPISSSGHLTVFQGLLGLKNPEENLLLYVILHLGTLIATVWFFRHDLFPLFSLEGWQDKNRRHLVKMLFFATVPTAIIGISFKDFFENLFGAPKLVCGTLFLTGLLLLIADYLSSRKTTKNFEECTILQAILIGIAQGIAITPGISRSGATISVAMLLGFSGTDAARFSFILMIPAVGGATLLHLKKIFAPEFHNDIPPLELVVGGLTSFIVGLFALKILVAFLKKQRLSWFAYYLFVASTTFFIALALKD